MQAGSPEEAYVWIWLPGRSDPVVAGRLAPAGDALVFNYGRSYLARPDALPIYLPELPLRPGEIPPLAGLRVAGSIHDGLPDSWGRRVIMNRILGSGATTADPGDVSLLTYLLESSSDRFGALDFQVSPTEYASREVGSASLEELLASAERVERGIPLSPELDRALLHGTSIGGARPKASMHDGDRALIAKFSSTTDVYPMVKAEYVGMELARRAGIAVAPVRLVQASGKDVLLVERFDRGPGRGERRAVVSALTILELDELHARYASYADLAQQIRERFTRPRATLHELFARMTFNVVVGNTDDHARNHAAFWDGAELTLTPAYDICPLPRGGGEASQAMAIAPSGFRLSSLAGCVEAAATYHLSEAEAREIVDRQVETVEAQWEEVCELAALTEVERSALWRRAILNPYVLEGYRR